MQSSEPSPHRQATVVGTVIAAFGSVDWIAWLALRGADPAARTTILSTLTGLVLALGRASTRLLALRFSVRSNTEDQAPADTKF